KAPKMFEFLYIPQVDPNPIPLADSPWPMTIILVSYMLFVFKLGKIFMRNREPYNLKKVLMVYNLFQVAYNGIYWLVLFYYLGILRICNLKCMVTFPQGHEHKWIQSVMQFTYILNKIIDLLDTVFFILRKSYKQITFLHVYHHVFMVAGSYVVTRAYGPGGHVIALGFFNSLVHFFMYFYYYLSSQYSSVKKSLWWKKYITILQILQFIVITLYSLYVRFLSPNCDAPHSLLYINIVQGIAFIYMFSKFYVRTYMSPPKAKPKEQ
ncbi:hypothetical protein KR018_008153, partial [Drosophila ironensis]